MLGARNAAGRCDRSGLAELRYFGACPNELICYYGREGKGADDIDIFEMTIRDIRNEGLLIGAVFIVRPESTSRLTLATGSWMMYALTEPFILGSDEPAAYWWEGKGKVTFQQLNHP
jgi:hypothetical protein